MTIAIAAQVHDGVVLASDSALTLIDPTKPVPDNVINVYNNANKIFNLCKGFPVGAVFYGMGSIGSSSMSTLAKDLRRRFAGNDIAFPSWKLHKDAFTVSEIAQRVREFIFFENYKSIVTAPATGVQMGMIVAGYSSGAQLSETWLLEIRDGDCQPPSLIIGQGMSNVYAGGDPEAFFRIVLGYSSKLSSALVKLGADPAQIDGVMQAIQSEVYEPLIEAPMPIQDVIDLAEFLVNTTIQFTRFKRGAATVGGPLESAAITKHEGFRWVKRKHYFSEEFNRTHLGEEHGR